MRGGSANWSTGQLANWATGQKGTRRSAWATGQKGTRRSAYSWDHRQRSPATRDQAIASLSDALSCASSVRTLQPAALHVRCRQIWKSSHVTSDGSFGGHRKDEKPAPSRRRRGVPTWNDRLRERLELRSPPRSRLRLRQGEQGVAPLPDLLLHGCEQCQGRVVGRVFR